MLLAVPPKRIARVEDLPRADIFQVVFSIFRVLVGEWSIHINFSTSAAFCAFGDAWATATELRVKNAICI